MWNPLKNVKALLDKSLDNLWYADELIEQELQKTKNKSLKYREFKERFNNHK